MVFNNSILLGAAGQGGVAPFDTTLIGNSVWLDGSSDQLEMAKTSGGSASSKFTVSCWIKRNKFAEGTFPGIFNHFFSSNTGVQLTWLSGDTLTWVVFSSTSGAGGQITSSGLFRDIGWYHILGNYDGTNGTMQLFVNGESVGIDSFTAGSTNPIGSGTSGASYYWGACKNTQGTFSRTNSYLAQCALELGTAAVPSDYVDTFTLGTNGSQVIPKKSSDLVSRINSAGGHSHLLDFATSSDLGNDISSNNNNFTATSMGPTNQSESTPSNTYATWNPLFGPFAAHAHTATLTEGNLRLSSSTSNYSNTPSTLAMPAGSGKFAAKFTVNTLGGIYPVIGVYDMDGDTSASFTGSSSSVGLRMDGQRYLDGNSASYGSAVSAGNTVEVELDMDNNTVEFLINGSAQGTISKTFTGTVVFMVQDGSNGSAIDVTAEFDYTPDDANFKNLNTANLTAPDFQGIDYFDATLYEGNGQNQRVGDFVPFTDTYTVDKSAMFDDGDFRYLTKTFDSGDATATSDPGAGTAAVGRATISYWIKFCSNGANQDILTTSNSGQTNRLRHYINDQSGQENIYMTLDGPSTNRNFLLPISKLSEQEWTNIVYNIDVDNSTAADKIKCWVNGVQQTSTDGSGSANPGATSYESASSADYFLFANEEHIIGNLAPSTAGYTAFSLNSYLAEMHVLDGQLKPPTDFGQVDTSTNRWVAKDYKTNVGAYGNRGFYMAFDSTFNSGSGAGTDSSGNNFHFTEDFLSGGSAWATSDQFTDTPSKNFAVLDPGTLKVSTGTLPIAEGNLKVGPKSGGGGGAYRTGTGFSIPEGSWIYKTTMPGKDANLIGVWTESGIATLDGGGSTKQTGFYGINVNNGELSHNKTETSASDAASIHGYTWASDIPSTQAMNVLINRTGSVYKLWFVKDGATAAAGNPAAGTGAHIEFSSTEAVYAGIMTTSTQHSLTFDFGASNSGSFTGNSNFSGYKLINQDNLDDTASKLTAWAWIKNRDADDSHILVDRVRGVGEVLHSDATDLEATEPDTVQRFLQRGVQVGNDVQVNTVNESYVLWQWLVGEAATTTTINASSTTPTNSIASTVAAADAGHFSVVGYQGNSTNGATVAHSLGGEPELIFFRGREGSGASSFLWRVFSTTGGAGKYLRLNDSTGLQDDTGYLNNTLPGSVVFTLGTDGDVNNSSYTYIAYCFRSVPGVCKIGTYEGNNNANGPYITTGFKVAATITKPVDASGSWMILDDKREPENPVQKRLFPNSNATEDVDGDQMDFYADGFKLRKAGGHNGSGTYLYLAMADIGGNGTLPPIYGR